MERKRRSGGWQGCSFLKRRKDQTKVLWIAVAEHISKMISMSVEAGSAGRREEREGALRVQARRRGHWLASVSVCLYVYICVCVCGVRVVGRMREHQG